MGNHAEMVVRGLPAIFVTDDWLARTGADLMEAVPDEWLWTSVYHYGEPALKRTTNGGSWYEEPHYGERFDAMPGECMVEVNLFARYWEPPRHCPDSGKELCEVADWIEAMLTGSSIWYAGDQGGRHFPWPKLRREIWKRRFNSEWVGEEDGRWKR